MYMHTTAMLPHLFHHSDNPYADEEDSSNSRNEQDHEKSDEEDEEDEEDEGDEGDEGDDSESVDDAERSDIRLLQVIIDFFQRMAKSASEVVSLAGAATNSYTNSYYDKQPYHTSVLTGVGWVNELLNGHPERIQCELGVHRHVFIILLQVLHEGGINDSKHVMLEEQLAIFLYACVMGISVCHLAERFQRSNDTISKCVLPLLSLYLLNIPFRYFKRILITFSSHPIYSTYV